MQFNFPFEAWDYNVPQRKNVTLFENVIWWQPSVECKKVAALLLLNFPEQIYKMSSIVLFFQMCRVVLIKEMWNEDLKIQVGC